jgi:hypothetical protein
MKSSSPAGCCSRAVGRDRGRAPGRPPLTSARGACPGRLGEAGPRWARRKREGSVQLRAARAATHVNHLHAQRLHVRLLQAQHVHRLLRHRLGHAHGRICARRTRFSRMALPTARRRRARGCEARHTLRTAALPQIRVHKSARLSAAAVCRCSWAARESSAWPRPRVAFAGERAAMAVHHSEAAARHHHRRAAAAAHRPSLPASPGPWSARGEERFKRAPRPRRRERTSALKHEPTAVHTRTRRIEGRDAIGSLVRAARVFCVAMGQWFACPPAYGEQAQDPSRLRRALASLLSKGLSLNDLGIVARLLQATLNRTYSVDTRTIFTLGGAVM